MDGCQPLNFRCSLFISSVFNVPLSLLTISGTKQPSNTFSSSWMLSCRIHVRKVSLVSPTNSLVSERCVGLLSARVKYSCIVITTDVESHKPSTCRPWLAWLWSFVISGMRNLLLPLVLSLHTRLKMRCSSSSRLLVKGSQICHDATTATGARLNTPPVFLVKARDRSL